VADHSCQHLAFVPHGHLLRVFPTVDLFDGDSCLHSSHFIDKEIEVQLCSVTHIWSLLFWLDWGLNFSTWCTC
jgi:hypothetical protein